MYPLLAHSKIAYIDIIHVYLYHSSYITSTKLKLKLQVKRKVLLNQCFWIRQLLLYYYLIFHLWDVRGAVVMPS